MTIYAPDHIIHDHVNALPQHLKDRPSKIDTLKDRPSNTEPQTQTRKYRYSNIEPSNTDPHIQTINRNTAMARHSKPPESPCFACSLLGARTLRSFG